MADDNPHADPEVQRQFLLASEIDQLVVRLGAVSAALGASMSVMVHHDALGWTMGGTVEPPGVRAPFDLALVQRLTYAALDHRDTDPLDNPLFARVAMAVMGLPAVETV